MRRGNRALTPLTPRRYPARTVAPFTLPSSQPLEPPHDWRAKHEEQADARPAETDEFELPRLIDLTRRLDRFPDRPADRFAQSDATLQPHESSPGARGRPASEKPDDDENWWRLP